MDNSFSESYNHGNKKLLVKNHYFDFVLLLHSRFLAGKNKCSLISAKFDKSKCIFTHEGKILIMFEISISF